MINDLVRPTGSAEASVLANDVRRLQRVIQQQHGSRSAHVVTVPLTEQHSGKILWQGAVEVFDLQGHATAQRCYAWTSQHNDGKEDYAVLEVPPVDSPRSAVRAVLQQVANSGNGAQPTDGKHDRFADSPTGARGWKRDLLAWPLSRSASVEIPRFRNREGVNKSNEYGAESNP